MKKVLTLIALCIGLGAQAQITLEHTYPNNVVYLSQVSDSNYVYYTHDSVNVYIYSASHTLLSTTAHGDAGTYYVQNVSQNLFDQDQRYEFITMSINLVSGSVVTAFQILNDDGSVIMSGLGQAVVRNSPDGAKLLVTNQSSTNVGSTKVYDLPGKPQTFGKRENPISSGLPYPNPSADWIKLPYEITGSTGMLNIVDMAGRVQKTYQISGMFKDILVEPGTLPAGQYLYYVEADGVQSKAKPFVIQ